MHLFRRIRPYWPVALALLALVVALSGVLSQDDASTPAQDRSADALLLAAFSPNANVQAALNAASSPTPGTYGPITGPPNTGAQPTQPSTGETVATVPPTAPPTIPPTAPPTNTAASGASVVQVTATPIPATLTPTPVPPTATPTVPFPATPLPALDASRIGVQVNPDLSEEDFDTVLWLAQKLGVKWFKFQFAWNLLEPNPGEYNGVFERYVLWVQRADAKGFNVMISVAKAPDWSRATLEESGPPTNPDDLGRMLADFLNRVRVDLTGQSYVDAIEIWNEPNLMREWHGATLSGAEYMRYFDAAYSAVRGAEGGAGVVLVTAGLAPTGIDDGISAIDDRRYLDQMYQAGLNSANYQNIAIGVHPYGAANPPDARCCAAEPYQDDPTWFFLDTIEDYRAIMERYNDTARQLWVTEFGWGTYQGFVLEDGSPAPGPVDPPYLNWLSELDQANYTIRAFEIGQSLSYLGPMMLWNLNFSRNEYIAQRDPRASYALLRNTADPLRPAYRLLEFALTGSSD